MGKDAALQQLQALVDELIDRDNMSLVEAREFLDSAISSLELTLAALVDEL